MIFDLSSQRALHMVPTVYALSFGGTVHGICVQYPCPTTPCLTHFQMVGCTGQAEGCNRHLPQQQVPQQAPQQQVPQQQAPQQASQQAPQQQVPQLKLTLLLLLPRPLQLVAHQRQCPRLPARQSSQCTRWNFTG